MSDQANDTSRKARPHLGAAICFALAALIWFLVSLTAHMGRGRNWIWMLTGCLFSLNAVLQFLAYRKAARAQAR